MREIHFVPFLSVDSALKEKQGAIGQLAHGITPQGVHVAEVDVFQIVDGNNLLLKWEKETISFSAVGGEVGATSNPAGLDIFWVSGVDTKNIPVENRVVLDPEWVFVVDGFKDYNSRIGGQQRVTHLKRIDPPEGVYVRKKRKAD